MQPIAKLDEGKATLRVLLYLHKNGETKLTAIIRDMPIGQKAVYTAMNTLSQLELLKEETSREFPFAKIQTHTKRRKNRSTNSPN